MSERSSKGGVGFPVVLNSLLVIATLGGGALLVSNRLTSDRPVTPTVEPSEAIGGQTLEVRLWEDPFHPSGEGQKPHQLPDFKNEIMAHKAGGNQVLLLPVMISGGPYSGDQEGRIRSRFAIVSALGQSGYAPEDAEHIGTVNMKWPTTRELEEWKKNSNAVLSVLPKYVPSENVTTNSITLQVGAMDRFPTGNVSLHNVALHHAAVANDAAVTHVSTNYTTNVANNIITTNVIIKMTLAAIGSLDLRVRYEWYKPRVFHPHSLGATNRTNVLVLWIDDALFEDHPLHRLPLFLAPLIQAADTNASSSNAIVRLIGPRRSTTLRAMLPDEFALPSPHNTNLWRQVAQTLGRIALYSATPNAMDEVLVSNTSNAPPRQVVRDKLRVKGFRDAHFFNATDAQMAEEILKELSLRGANFTNTANHLILLSEWDTFYGRMLSLTYGATLARWQSNAPVYANLSSRAQFVQQYRAGSSSFPSNFHTYVYLRGLDGQTAGGHGHGDPASDKPTDRARSKPGAFEDLLRWKPDANKPEGPGQFDYLSRTGDRLVSLQKELKLSGRGEIKAVGIVGSDVYDVLLILQALRGRFPTVLFFTTDLDTRFSQPREREWARNLVVASSYGLKLHPDLQQEVAPFRDSAQTAQFVAALAALGHTNLQNFTYGGVRRFEIGNRVPVDLSVSPTNCSLPSSTHARLHPLTRSENYLQHPNYNWNRPVWLTLWMLGFALALAVYFFWSPFRRRSCRECGYLSASLPFSGSDVGGPEGAEGLIGEIFRSADPFCVWMVEQLQKRDESLFPPLAILIPETAPEPIRLEINARTRKLQEQRAEALMGLLNDILHHVTLVPKAVTLAPGLMGPSAAILVIPAFPRWKIFSRFWQRIQTRRVLDYFLSRLPGRSPTLRVASDARKAARKLFWVRLRLTVGVAGTVVVAGIAAVVMGLAIWNDTLTRPDGEPFSLITGTSAWPNVILRALSTVLAVLFCYILLEQLRFTYYDVTRRYRLPLKPLRHTAKPQHIWASQLWKEFHRTGQPGWRLLRAFIPCALYFIFGSILFLLFGPPFEPFRGDAVKRWADHFNHFLGFQPLNLFVLSFLFLSFLTIDAALRCRRFINDLGAAATDYPTTTHAHFKRQRGDVGEEYLDEWIDTNLIADLTERVGDLLWFPGIVFLLMLAARNQWTDHWPTSTGLLLILVLNSLLALSSVVILQRAARKAKKQAMETLAAKVKKAQAAIASTPQHNDAAQAEKLLEEIRNLDRGAFVGFWENPALGAVLLAPGGTAVIQLLVWLMNR